MALVIAGAIVATALMLYAYSFMNDVHYSPRLTIASTTDIASLDGVTGSGTATDPYILQGMNFIADLQYPMITISYRDDHIILRNIVIEGNNDNGLSDEFPYYNEDCVGIYLRNANNCTISHCSFTSMFAAVQAINCQDLSVTNCLFSACRNAIAINIDDELNPFPWNRNIMIQTNYYVSCAYAIVACNFDNLTIEENTLQSCQRGIVAYTEWLNGASSDAIGLNVLRNTVLYMQNARTEGFISVSSCSEVTIAGNDARSKLDCFADIEQSSGVSVTDNIVTSRCMGIVACDCQCIEIQNNSFNMEDYTEITYTGVRIIDCSNLTLVGNNIGSWLSTNSVSVELLATFTGATTGVASDNVIYLLVETEGVEVVWS